MMKRTGRESTVRGCRRAQPCQDLGRCRPSDGGLAHPHSRPAPRAPSAGAAFPPPRAPPSAALTSAHPPPRLPERVRSCVRVTPPEGPRSVLEPCPCGDSSQRSRPRAPPMWFHVVTVCYFLFPSRTYAVLSTFHKSSTDSPIDRHFDHVHIKASMALTCTLSENRVYIPLGAGMAKL